MTTRPLFLRFACIASASVLTIIALALAGFANGVSGAPLALCVFIVAVTAAATAFAGVLHWRGDELDPRSIHHSDRYERLRHDAHLVFYTVAFLQLLGMVGALLGYRQQTASAAIPDSQTAIHALTLGLGNGMTATLAGVVCSLCVWAMFLHLQHALDKPA